MNYQPAVNYAATIVTTVLTTLIEYPHIRRSNLSFPGYFPKVEKYIAEFRIVSNKMQALFSALSKRNAQKGTINFS